MYSRILWKVYHICQKMEKIFSTNNKYLECLGNIAFFSYYGIYFAYKLVIIVKQCLCLMYVNVVPQ